MRLPLDDWQFWVVTLLALGGLWMLWRALKPRGKRPSRKSQLTIEGKSPRGT